MGEDGPDATAEELEQENESGQSFLDVGLYEAQVFLRC